METPTKEMSEKGKDLINNGVDGDADNGKEERQKSSHRTSEHAANGKEERQKSSHRTSEHAANGNGERQDPTQDGDTNGNTDKGKEERKSSCRESHK